MKKITLALLALTAIMLQGCATSRSVVDIEAPAASTMAQTSHSSQPGLYIRQITDERTFQDAPKSADIPSLGFGGASAAKADIKARAIGRKRGGYGKALGDVLLPKGTTVKDLVRASARQGFADAGWHVVDSPDARESVTTVDIAITRFWTWVKPGFWAIALNTDIETEFDFSNQLHANPVHVHRRDGMQFIVDSDWQKNVELTLGLYRDAIVTEINP